MDVKEQLKSKSLSELFMLIRNGSGAIALSASEEIERRLSAQQMRAADALPCGHNQGIEFGESSWSCVVCGQPVRR